MFVDLVAILLEENSLFTIGSDSGNTVQDFCEATDNWTLRDVLKSYKFSLGFHVIVLEEVTTDQENEDRNKDPWG